MVHFVLEDLSEQAGSAASEFFAFFIISFHRHFFGSYDCAENADYAKAAFFYGLLFLGNFRNFRVYESYDFYFIFSRPFFLSP